MMKNSKQNINKIQTTKKTYNLFFHLIFVITCTVCVYPFLVIIGSSLQSQSDIIKYGYSIVPKQVTLLAYQMILKDPKILINSYLVTVFTTVVGSLAGVCIITAYAYAISRTNYKYKKILSFYVFFTMLFNGGLVPTYIIMVKWLGLKDNILALILPYLISGWFVLLMKGFLQTIPEALVEAAKIDGAGEVYAFVKIVLPISKPALATVGLFLVLQYWNDWWLTLLYIDSDHFMKLQYLLMRVLKNLEFLNSSEAVQYGLLKPGMEAPALSARMAMCILAAGPMLAVFPFFQKYFVRGLTIGSVKG